MFTEKYERNLKGNSLIFVENLEYDEDSFEEKMICENAIKGLLPCAVRYEDDKKAFVYDITSMQSLSQMFEERMLRESDVRKMIHALIMIRTALEEYLLCEDNLVLDPKYVYEDPDHRNPQFVFYPYYDKKVEESLTILSTFLMERTDHKDEEAVKLVYGLYKCIFNKDYSFEKLLIRSEEKDSEKAKENSSNNLSEKSETANDAFPDREEPAGTSGRGEKIAVFVSTIILLLLIGAVVTIKFADFGLDTYDIRKAATVIAFLGALALSIPICLGSRVAAARKSERKHKEIEKEVIANKKNVNCIKAGGNRLIGKTGNLKEEIKDVRRLVCYGMGDVVEFRIVKTPFIVGKSVKEVDGVINDDAISRIHAKIVQKDNTFYITDLNSTNGTTVNGSLLNANETVEICVNDEISFAGNVFYFR